MPLSTSHASGQPILAADINAIATEVNDHETRVTALEGGGGSSVVVVGYKSTVAESNSALPTGDVWAEWRTAARLTAAAAVGDRIVCVGSAFLDNQAATYYFDWGIVNASTNAIIRRFGGAFGQGFASGSAYQNPALTADFTVASGDIVSGNVTVAQLWRGNGARNLLLADYIYGIRAMFFS